MDGGTGGGQHLESRLSRGALWFGVVGGGAFVVLGAIVCFTGPVGLAIGGLCIAFFGFIVVTGLRRLRADDRRPVVVIDEQGLFDRRLTDEPIPWSAVRSVEVRPGPTLYSAPQRFVTVEVDDPDRYVRRTRGTRLTAAFNRTYGFTPVTLGVLDLEHGAAEIAEAARSHLPRAAEGDEGGAAEPPRPSD